MGTHKEVEERPLYCGLCQRLWSECEKNICSTRKFFNWFEKALKKERDGNI